MGSLARYRETLYRSLYVMSIMLAGLIIVAWPVSYVTSVILYWGSPRGVTTLMAHDGGLWMSQHPSGTVAWKAGARLTRAHPLRGYRKEVVEQNSFLGFLQLPRIHVIPFWALFAGTSVYQAWWLTRPKRYPRRFASGHCQHCGYDLRGSFGRCPECGHVVGTGRVEALPPRPRPRLSHASVPRAESDGPH